MRFGWVVELPIVLVLALPGQGKTDCGLEMVRVDAACEADRRIACAGVKRALGAVGRCGCAMQQPLRIRFLEVHEKAFPGEEGSPYTDVPVSGFYLADTGCAYAPSSSIPVESRPPALGQLLMTDEFLSSVVAHEVTHHIYRGNCVQRRQAESRAASEYLSYVVQIGTLAEPERSRALTHWPGRGLSSRSDVNAFLWALDPPRFGVMAYRYHRTDPKFFCELLLGKYSLYDGDIPSQ